MTAPDADCCIEDDVPMVVQDSPDVIDGLEMIVGNNARRVSFQCIYSSPPPPSSTSLSSLFTLHCTAPLLK